MEQNINIQKILSNQKELRIYSVENAEKIANKITAINYENFADNEMLEQINSSLIFRDNMGKYWHIDLASKTWKKYDDGWREKVPPYGYLEGLADLQAWLHTKQNINDSAFEDVEKIIDSDDLKQASSITNAKDTLTEIINETWQDYIKGLLTSISTDILLREYMIVDNNADFWTLGCRSGYWYRFNGKSWEKSDTAPDDETIVKSEDLDQFIDEIKHTVLMIFKSGKSFLPEHVTTLWEPPELKLVQETQKDAVSFNILVSFCPNCGAEVKIGANFCTKCGTKV